MPLKTIKKFIFGESPSQDITPTGTLTPEQEQSLTALLQGLTGSAGGQGAEVPAGLKELQKLFLAAAGNTGALTGQAKGAISNILGGGEPTPRASELFPDLFAPLAQLLTQNKTPQNVMETLDKLMKGTAVDFEEAFQENVFKPLTTQFQEDIAPGITRRFAPSGFYSQNRLVAEERAREDLLDAITANRARYQFETQESALNRSLQAAIAGGDISTSERGHAVQAGLGATNAAVSESGSIRNLFTNALGLAAPTDVSLLSALSGGAGLFTPELESDTSVLLGQLDALVRALNTGAIENIVFNNPGQSGALIEAIKAYAKSQGAGG
jgi:hypothetical protein